MDYKDLAFYKKARQVTQEIDVEIRTWPISQQAQTTARQLFRASASVGANIAEGHGRHTGLEYIHFLIIAQGSANEVDHWLNLVLDCRIGRPENIMHLISLNTETRKMLTSTINNLQQKITNKTLRETPAIYSIEPNTPPESDETPRDPLIPYSSIPYKEDEII